jgi:hypothetical protein
VPSFARFRLPEVRSLRHGPLGVGSMTDEARLGRTRAGEMFLELMDVSMSGGDRTAAVAGQEAILAEDEANPYIYLEAAGSVIGCLIEEVFDREQSLTGLQWRSDPRLKRLVRRRFQPWIPRKLRLWPEQMVMLLRSLATGWRTCTFRVRLDQVDLELLVAIAAIIVGGKMKDATWDLESAKQEWASGLDPSTEAPGQAARSTGPILVRSNMAFWLGLVPVLLGMLIAAVFMLHS